MHLRLIIALLVVACLGASLTACGQKGGLYLPGQGTPAHAQQ